MIDTQSKGTITDKITGEVTERRGYYLSDAFIFVLPRLEGGVALGESVFHPTLGIVLQDSVMAPTNASEGSNYFYSIDLGLAVGAALVLAEGKFVINPTLRFWGSLYDGQTHPFDGGGGSADIMVGTMVGPVSLMLRLGADGHNLHGKGWVVQSQEETVHQSSKFFSVSVGYMPQ